MVRGTMRSLGSSTKSQNRTGEIHYKSMLDHFSKKMEDHTTPVATVYRGSPNDNY